MSVEFIKVGKAYATRDGRFFMTRTGAGWMLWDRRDKAKWRSTERLREAKAHFARVISEDILPAK